MPPKRRTFVLREMAATSFSPLPKKVARKSGLSISHPGTSIMVMEALKALDSRKGVSKYAIQNFILHKYPTVDRIRMNYFVRRALKKGLENGSLVRPPNSTVTTGVVGKFRLAPKSKVKAENLDPNVQKVPEAAKEAPKKTKAGGTKKKTAADEQPKLPKKEAPKGTKKEEEALRSKAAPAKKPKVKKSADEVVDSKAKPREAAASKKTKAKKVSDEVVADTKAEVKSGAKSKEVKDATAKKTKAKKVTGAEVKEPAAAGKTKAKEAKVGKRKAAKEPASKAPAKQGRKNAQ
ncbi:histone H1-beta, late embryonic [Syngnathoides biaculeatus]|uniref:histone H1-beta, late embryonic n=1 Tax=Syngnathoides biaculeatus TaxID=300417 RepID=UPI002ADE0B29|nr:histone H1-beta, late embryonic [Syngnathoides biaculeatus]